MDWLSKNGAQQINASDYIHCTKLLGKYEYLKFKNIYLT